MTRLNTVGADVAERGLVRAAVDVTGFGLLSHLGAMCASSKVGAEISAASVPAISNEVFDLIAANCIPGGSRDNLTYANDFTEWDGVTRCPEDFADGRADQRRPAAVRAAEKSEGRFEAPRESRTRSAPR